MTLAEFKAWFNGFTESMESGPTEKQWERIKARVAEIDDKPISYPVFIDRYLPYQRWPYLDHRPYWFGGATTSGGAMLYSSNLKNTDSPKKSIGEGTYFTNNWNEFFNSTAAMTDLGKAEYSSLAA
jgi:hypothetical protein